MEADHLEEKKKKKKTQKSFEIKVSMTTKLLIS